MPRPIPVQLVPHDPAWAIQARHESERLHAVFGRSLIAIHHIGSTAVPGICAKPILDLLAVFVDLASLDARRADMERLGYAWWGEYGLTGRRYCTRDNAWDGRRLVQLHAYAQASRQDVTRHLAFRDHLRARPSRAEEYEREKHRCAALHKGNSHSYADCKSALIARIEAEAIGMRGE